MDTKKLRQKILDLAIHGKLVPQDPSDEPASVLLERIKTEKERLIKEGKIKKNKKSTKASDTPHYENVPFEVPESWVWTTGNEIFSPLKSCSPRGDIFIYVDIDAINNKANIIDKPKTIRTGDAPSRASRYTQAGDVLFSMVRPYLRNIAIVPENGWIASTGFYVCSPTKLLLSQYCFYLMLSDYVVDGLNKYMKGDNSPSINNNHITSWLYPIPPLAEQQRIVAEIKHWFALIDQLEQDKDDLQATIKQAKSKILDLAIHGKLVAQDPNDEPAIELLKRINPDFTPCDNEHYTQLPKGWVACRLEQVAEILDNLRKPINASERESRIKNKKIDELYPYYGATGQVGLIDDYVVNGHYLLLGEDGAPFLDKNAIKAYSISGKGWVNNHAHILSPKIDFEFLQYSLNQIDYSEYVNGSTRLKLTQTDMRSIKIMLPPLAEQERIKSKIQTLFSQLDLIMESL